MAQNTAGVLNDLTMESEAIADLIESGDLAAAQRRCEAFYKQFPNSAEALHSLAMVCQAQGKMPQAIGWLKKAIEEAPDFEMAYFNLAILYEQTARPDEAAACYRQLLAIAPKNHMALLNYGMLLAGQGKHVQAEGYYRSFIEIMPYHSQAHNNLGSALINQGRFDEALPFCEKAVMLALDNVEAHNNRGIVYAHRGQLDKAESAFKRALKIAPDYVPAARNLQMVEQKKANPAMDLSPQSRLQDFFLAGNKALENRQFDEAISQYKQALAIHQNVPEILVNLGMALTMQRRFPEALAVLKHAVSLDDKNPDAFFNAGNVYKDAGQYKDAMQMYRHALALRPDFFEAWVNMGLVLRELKSPAEAVLAYKNALNISPEKMLRADPGHVTALAMLIREQQTLCLWDKLDGLIARLHQAIEQEATQESYGYGVFSASSLITIPCTPQQQLTGAKKCSKLNYGAIARPYDPARKLPMDARKDGKIRVGYVSGDFFSHATAWLITGLFEKHDRERFSVYGYSYSKPDGSDTQKRIMKAVDTFCDVRALSDEKAAELIAKDQIDILIDLKGYTREHRLGILAGHPAPIQLHYLGYPGTTGAPFIDYFIADKIVAPESMAPFFTEKLVYLPHCYQINDDKRAISSHTPSRAECGLPETGKVFCSFNQNYKITSPVFDVWMRLLGENPGSVLWLYITADLAMDNLRMEAQKRGIDPKRLVFAQYMPLEQHLARYRHVDFFLDTFPVNAHTTASDALWCGVPVVTMVGETFVSRVAASLNHELGLDELTAPDLAAYEALAMKMAKDEAYLADVRQRLAKARENSALFNTQTVTHSIEAAYQQMIERHRLGKALESFSVAAK